MAYDARPTDRRRFLQAGLGFATAWATGPLRAAASRAVDADCWALLSDTHVPADPATVRHGIRPADQLERIVADVVARGRRPAHALINGDCASRQGDAGDYATFARLIAPLAAEGAALHMTLGNHDDRTNFRTGPAARSADERAMESHQVGVVETGRADWFLLDSLDRPHQCAGRLGAAQLRWLAERLAERPDKPAIVAVHHTPEFLPLPNPVGIVDTLALLEVFRKHRRVKAMFFGHSHIWTRTVIDGVHFVSLPPTSYLFFKDRPIGWVEALVRDDGVSLELQCLDPTHREHGDRAELAWRADRTGPIAPAAVKSNVNRRG